MTALKDDDLAPYFHIALPSTVPASDERESPLVSRLLEEEERDEELARRPEAALPWTDAGAAAMRIRARERERERAELGRSISPYGFLAGGELPPAALPTDEEKLAAWKAVPARVNIPGEPKGPPEQAPEWKFPSITYPHFGEWWEQASKVPGVPNARRAPLITATRFAGRGLGETLESPPVKALLNLFSLVPATAAELGPEGHVERPIERYIKSFGQESGREEARTKLKDRMADMGLAKGVADVLASGLFLAGELATPGQLLKVAKSGLGFGEIARASRVAAAAAETERLEQAALRAAGNQAYETRLKAFAEEARMEHAQTQYEAFAKLADEAEKFQAAARRPSVAAAEEEASKTISIKPPEPQPLAPEHLFAPTPMPEAGSKAAERRLDLLRAPPEAVPAEYAFPPELPEVPRGRSASIPSPAWTEGIPREVEPVNLPLTPSEGPSLLPRGSLVTPPPAGPRAAEATARLLHSRLESEQVKRAPADVFAPEGEERSALDEGEEEARRRIESEASEAASARTEDAAAITGKIRPDGLRGDLRFGEGTKVLRLLRAGPRGDVSTIARALSPYFDPAFVVRKGEKVVSIKGLEEYLNSVPSHLRGTESTANTMDQAAEALFRAEKTASADIDEMGRYLGGPGFEGEEGAAFFRPASQTAPVPPAVVKPSARGGGPGFTSGAARQYVSDLLNVVIAKAGNLDAATPAMYRMHAKDISVANPQDFGPIAHEMMHKIEDSFMTGGKFSKLGGGPWALYADELDPLATHATASSSRTSEGAAEFMRHYLVEPERARAAAPRFFQDLPSILRTQDPALSEGVARLQAKIQAHNAMSAGDRFMAHVVGAMPDPKPLDMKTWDRLLFGLVDDIRPVRQFEDETAKLGGNVPKALAPAAGIEVLRNATGLRELWTKHFISDFAHPMKAAGPSLQEAMRAFPDAKEGAKYLMAKRLLGKYDDTVAAVLNKKRAAPMVLPQLAGKTGIQMSQPDLLAAYRDMVASASPATVKAAEGAWKQMTDAVVDHLSNAGIFSAEEARKLKFANNATYVPFHRIMELSNPDTFRPFRGESSLEILDPFEAMNRNMAAYVVRKQQNLVNLGLVDTIRRAPGLSTYVRMLPGQFQDQKFLGDALADIAKGYGASVEEYAELHGMTKGDLLQLVASGSDSNPILKEKGIRFAFNKKGVSGVRPIPQLDRDVIAFQVVDPAIREALKNASWVPGNPISKTMYVLANAFRAGTVHTPAFALLGHLPSAIAESMVLSSVQKIPFIDAVQDGIKGFVSILKKDPYYHGAIATGGIRGEGTLKGAMLGDRPFAEEFARDIKLTPRSALGKAARFLFVDVPNAGLNAVQVGAFRRAVERTGQPLAGLGREEAARISELVRYSSANPAVHGAWTGMVRALIPFWNIGLQHTRGLGVAFADHPVRAMIGLSSLMGASTAGWFANRGNKAWQDASLQERQRYWFVGPVKIAKPRGVLGAIVNSVEHGLDAVARTRPDALHEQEMEFARLGDDLLPVFGHPVIGQAIEAAFGKRADQPLQGLLEGGTSDVIPQRLQHLAPKAQRYPDQGLIETGIGKALGVSPIRVGRAVQAFGGTVGGDVLKAADAAASLFGGPTQPTTPWTRLPFVSRVMAEQHPQRMAAEDFAWRSLKAAETEIATAKAERRPVDPAALRDKARFEPIVKALRELAGRVLAIRGSSLSREEKRSRIDKLNDRMADLARTQYHDGQQGRVSAPAVQ